MGAALIHKGEAELCPLAANFDVEKFFAQMAAEKKLANIKRTQARGLFTAGQVG